MTRLGLFQALVGLAAMPALGACSEEPEDNRCFFDGLYETGFVPRMAACVGGSFRALIAEEDSCTTEGVEYNFQGTEYRYFIGCEPGDPVVDCFGAATYADGCVYDVYVRRVGP